MTDPPVEPRLAATVVLVRPGRGGLEVLLTKRPASMAFAANMQVFPGGRVDEGDVEPSLLARSAVSSLEAARGLGGDLEPNVALATYVAAIRELFEEAGVLLADAAIATAPRSIARARVALVGGEMTFGAIAAELDLRLRTDLLVPLSRWVTPPILPRRFDARFFAAELPAAARVSFEGGEVESHAWLTPAAALRAMSEGEIELWLPTSATLQQLEHAASVGEMRERLAPGPLGPIEEEAISPEITRIVMPAAGGVAGQPVCAYLVGHRRHVLIDPGDPTGPSLDRAMELAAARGGSIDAVALTHVDPDHAGGAEALAEILGVPVLAGSGSGRSVPYAVTEVPDGEWIDACDAPLRTVWTPGPRADHLAFVVGGDPPLAITGDLDGRRGDRMIPAPIEGASWSTSRARMLSLVGQEHWLAGHPTPGLSD